MSAPSSTRRRCELGASVAVIGLGGVGLAVAPRRAVAAGARQIIAVDLSDDKLELARQLGATHTVNAGRGRALEQIRELTVGRRRVRLRIGRIDPRAGPRLQHHAARRHDRHRRPAAVDRDAGRCPPSAWSPKNAR